MGTTGTLLVGIACVLAQGSPEAGKLKEQLTVEEAQLIEQLRETQVCEQLDQYVQQGNSGNNVETILMGCSSCLKTTSGLKVKADEK